MNGPAGKPQNAWRMLGLVSVAQVLGMTLWFSATAGTPLFAADLRLFPDQATWVTLAVQAGFVAGTLIRAFGHLADRINPRRLVFFGCVAGAVADTPARVIALGFGTGARCAGRPSWI